MGLTSLRYRSALRLEFRGAAGDEAFDRFDARLAFGDGLGQRGDVFANGAFELFAVARGNQVVVHPDADEVAREVVTVRETVERLAG